MAIIIISDNVCGYAKCNAKPSIWAEDLQGLEPYTRMLFVPRLGEDEGAAATEEFVRAIVWFRFLLGKQGESVYSKQS